MSTTIVELSNAIKYKISQANLNYNLGISRIEYGDVNRITDPIQVCIDPESKRTELRTIGRGVGRSFRIHILVYFSYITNPMYNREFCDTMAETLENYLNEDATMGGLITNGYITEVASGHVVKDSVVVRANRLTYEATVTDRLPS